MLNESSASIVSPFVSLGWFIGRGQLLESLSLLDLLEGSVGAREVRVRRGERVRVESGELHLARDAQDAGGLEDSGQDVERGESENEEHDQRPDQIAQRVDRREAVRGDPEPWRRAASQRRRRWIAPQHKAGDRDPKESGDAVDRDCAHRVVDLESSLGEIVELVGDHRPDAANDHRLDRVI